MPSADCYQRALAVRPMARTEHFVLHHVVASAQTLHSSKLSTGLDPMPAPAVEDLRVGWIIPKRQARRAVTRNLVRRQMRAAFDRHAGQLPAGDWLLRLRAGFDKSAFTSPASDALRDAVRSELDSLMRKAAR
jgi:ribonuclease P protein component